MPVASAQLLDDLGDMIDEGVSGAVDDSFSGNTSVDGNIDTGGGSIRVDDDSVSIETDDTSIVTDNENTTVSTPGATIESTPSRTTITTDSASISTNNTTVPMEGGVIGLSENTLSLSAQSQDGNIQISVDEVDLSTEGSVIIQNGDDLAIYAELAEERPGVGSVSVSENEVSVEYTTKGWLFGFIPLTMRSSVVVDNNGLVSVKLPWYSFLVFGTNVSQVQKRTQDSLSVSTSEASIYVNQAQKVDVVTSAISIATQNESQIVVDDEGVLIEGEGGTINVDSDGGINMQGEDGSIQVR